MNELFCISLSEKPEVKQMWYNAALKCSLYASYRGCKLQMHLIVYPKALVVNKNKTGLGKKSCLVAVVLKQMFAQ